MHRIIYKIFCNKTTHRLNREPLIILLLEVPLHIISPSNYDMTILMIIFMIIKNVQNYQKEYILSK